MKRTAQEIERTLQIVKEQDVPGAEVIETVLQEQLSESQVFDRYMRVADADRDEFEYYVGRDAAQWLTGKLSLGELVPGAEDFTGESLPIQETDSDTITINRSTFEQLLKRIEKLEYWTGLKRKKRHKELETLPSYADASEFITQNEAARIMGTTKRVMRGHIDRGELEAWQDGRFVKFRKSDILRFMEQKTQSHE